MDLTRSALLSSFGQHHDNLFVIRNNNNKGVSSNIDTKTDT